MQQLIAFTLFISFFASLHAGGKEEALKQLEIFSQKPFDKDKPHRNHSDHGSINSEKFLENFKRFENRLDELNPFSYPFIIIEATNDYLLPFLYLLREKKVFRYYGIALSNLYQTTKSVDELSIIKNSYFESLQTIKESLLLHNKELSTDEIIIIGLEHDSDRTIENSYAIRQRLWDTAEIIKCYNPKKIMALTNFNGLYHSADINIDNAQRELVNFLPQENDHLTYFIDRLEGDSIKVEVHSLPHPLYIDGFCIKKTQQNWFQNEMNDYAWFGE